MNALPNNTQKITRKHGKSYILSRGGSKNATFHSWHFDGKRSHFYRKWSVNPRDAFDTKRRTTRFKVIKALNNKFVSVFITCKVYENWTLIEVITGFIVHQENRSSPKAASGCP